MSDQLKHSLTSLSSCDSSSSARDKKLNKIISLFEIRRPNKTYRGLKRTMSLPSNLRPREVNCYIESQKMEISTGEIKQNRQGNTKDKTLNRVKIIKEKLEKVGLTYQDKECFTQNSKIGQINFNPLLENTEGLPDVLQQDIVNDNYKFGHNIEENIYEEIKDNSEYLEKPIRLSLDGFLHISKENLQFFETAKEAKEKKIENFQKDYHKQNKSPSPTPTKLNNFENFYENNRLYEQIPNKKCDYAECVYQNLPPYRNLTCDIKSKIEVHSQKNNFSELVQAQYIELTNNEAVLKHSETSKLVLAGPSNLPHFTRQTSTRRSSKSPYRKSSKEIIAKRKEQNIDNMDNENLNNAVRNSRQVSVKQRVLAFEEKERILTYDTFTKAKERGDIEDFRQNLISIIDEEIEDMENEGYEFGESGSSEDQSDTDNEVKWLNLNKPLPPEPIMQNQDTEIIYDIPEPTLQYRPHEIIYDVPDQFKNNADSSVPTTPEHYEEPPEYIENHLSEYQDPVPCCSSLADEFGEILFAEDLENGLYFVEAYNAENRELVIATLQVDRHCVYPNNISNVPISDLLAQQTKNSSKTFVFLNQKLVPSISEISLNDSSSSNRNTIYSTTSGDSCFSFDDLRFDKDFDENAHSKHNSLYNQCRRETISDNKGVVRIERVYMEPSSLESPKANKYFDGFDQIESDMYEYIHYEPTTSIIQIPECDKKDKLDYLLEEIRVSEAKYVDDLRKIVEDYKPFIENHSDINVCNKSKYIFGNIEELYDRQKYFYESLENGYGGLKDIIKAFIKNESLFKIYPKYISYKLKANYLVKELEEVLKERQEQLNDKLSLSSYLVTPVQRLGKYKLLLENILKQLQKEDKPIGSVTMALEIIKREMSNGNDAVAVSSIQGCPIYEFGSFIMREKFFCEKPRRTELMVFLFEKVIVFATEDSKTIDLFYYEEHIKMDQLRIHTSTNDDKILELIDFERAKKKTFYKWKYTFVLVASNRKVKETWRQAIEGILWKQLQTLKENTIRKLKNGNKSSKRRTKSSSTLISSVASTLSLPTNVTNDLSIPSTSSSELSISTTNSNTIPRRASSKEKRERIKSTDWKENF